MKRNRNMIVCNPFTLNQLKELGFPIKRYLGKAKISNKANDTWQSGKGASILKISTDEVYYAKTFGGSIFRDGTILDVPVYSDNSLELGLIRFIISEDHKEIDIDDIDELLNQMEIVLKA